MRFPLVDDVVAVLGAAKDEADRNGGAPRVALIMT